MTCCMLNVPHTLYIKRLQYFFRTEISLYNISKSVDYRNLGMKTSFNHESHLDLLLLLINCSLPSPSSVKGRIKMIAFIVLRWPTRTGSGVTLGCSSGTHPDGHICPEAWVYLGADPTQVIFSSLTGPGLLFWPFQQPEDCSGSTPSN